MVKGLLSRSIVLCWLAFAIVACDEQPEAETATPERADLKRADPGRADPERVSTVIAAKPWLDLKDRTPPEQWLASREAGEDVPSSSSGVAELRALLAQADRRYGETPRMIANRAVQLEAMLAERGIEETARRVIEGLIAVGREDDPRNFGETAQHYFNIRVTGMSREEALLSLVPKDGSAAR